MTLLDNPSFAATYRRLAAVRLNPRRHTAGDALTHSEAVAGLAGRLARANQLGDAAVAMLEDLGRAHDIGKVTGTARPERSLAVLHACGVDDPAFLALVKWHDTSLPWWRSSLRGEGPSERAWKRLAREVDLSLLALFMVADRVDAPAGWRRNPPTRWFLDQASARGLIGELVLDLPDHPSEVSAGAALVRNGGGGRELLFIRVRSRGFELPKGGVEWDELPADAAARELREETGLDGDLRLVGELGAVDYLRTGEGTEYLKRVRYFQLHVGAGFEEGDVPTATRERRWVSAGELERLPLVNDDLRPLARAALG